MTHRKKPPDLSPRQSLWLPSSDSTLLAPSRNILENHPLNDSWFSSDLWVPKTPQHVFLDTKVNDKFPSKTPQRCRSFEFFPSSHLRQVLVETFRIYRRIFNYCVQDYRAKLIPREFVGARRATFLRQSWTNAKNRHLSKIPNHLYERFMNVPSNLRAYAVKDFIDALSIQEKMIREGKKQKFRMHFRSDKDLFKTIGVPHKYIFQKSDKSLGIFPRLWKDHTFTFKEQIFKPTHDCRIKMTPNRRFFLIVPIDSPIQEKVQQRKVAALDPGIKIFQTVYGSDNVAYTIGEDDANKLDSLGGIAQRMRNGIFKVKRTGRKRYRKAKNKKERKILSKKAAKIEMKIRNRVDDLQKKLANFLCKNYDLVIIPEFRVKQITRKSNGNYVRRITRKSTRQMLRWAHYRFRQTLIDKGEITNTKIIVGTEEYTSKRCTRCERIKQNLSLRDRVHKCKFCGHQGHRDICAARNIMILNWDKDPVKGKRGIQISRT